jgi:hypothetical protein
MADPEHKERVDNTFYAVIAILKESELDPVEVLGLLAYIQHQILTNLDNIPR